MSSSSSMPVHSAPATIPSKRLSLNLSPGPRPLHLVNGNSPLTNSGPVTAPFLPNLTSIFSDYPPSPSSAGNGNTPSQSNPRRHSSISYRSHTSDDPYLSRFSPEGPPSPRPGLKRGNSLGLRSMSLVTSPTRRDRRSAGSEIIVIQERPPPLTLAEKHSELLHFIAQKEAKCLELRSQLAVHEAELLQLKRKWERIVNRGLSEGSSMLNSNGQSSGAVLEGIMEGVQGVGRLIASVIAEPSTPTTTPRSIRSSPIPPPLRLTQSSNLSTCNTSKSARLSHSSITSEPPTLRLTENQDEASTQILMVQDTGATPTMSPNPAFEYQRQQLELRTNASTSTRSSLETQANTRSTSSKMRRRLSRDGAHQNEHLSGESSSPTSPSEAAETERLKSAWARKANMNGTSLSPVSSIPGLASLALGVPSPPVSSWMEHVGKKWGELSTLSNNQKRASIILSDVSQSIASALSFPGSSPKSPSLAPPPYFRPTSPLTTHTTTSTSLLDDDDFAMPTSAVLTPQPLPSLTSMARSNNHPVVSQHLDSSKTNTDYVVGEDKESDWNW